MEYILISFVVFAVVVFLMAVGVIFSNRRIEGSCGGIGKILGNCDDCPNRVKNGCADE